MHFHDFSIRNHNFEKVKKVVKFSRIFPFTVPVDHTFFLANFCTASLASSTMASFLPPASKQNQVGYQQQRYDSTKKINGTMGPPPGVGPTPPQPQTASPPQNMIKVRPTSGQPQPQDVNGVIDALTSGNQPQNGPQNFSGIYNDADFGGHGGRQADMSNGLYGQHELVAAISQITAEPPTAVGQQPQQQNKAFNKAKKLWPASEAAGGQTENQGQKGQNDTEPVSKGPPRGFGGQQRPASGQTRSSGGRGGYSGGQNNEMNLASDNASDSLSSTSEEVGNATSASVASAAATGEIGDNGKPLSFARIASLNLEKQALQARAAAAAAAASAASSGKGASNPTSSTNANASMANNEAMIMSTASMASMNNSNLQAAAAAAAASMANMTMAEAAAVAAAQQVIQNSKKL